MEFNLPIPTTLQNEELLLSFYGCLENSDDGFLFVDPNGNIAFINDAYCRYINVSRKNVLGKPILDYIDTSLLVETASNINFKTQTGVLHRVSEHQYQDGEHYCIVNRSNISMKGKSVCGVGQIKFVRVPLNYLQQSMMSTRNSLITRKNCCVYQQIAILFGKF